MSRFSRKTPSRNNNVRLTAAGTRVVVIRPDAPDNLGTISDVRTATHLRPYVVTCDDGALVYASSYDLALEGDATRTLLGRRPVD